MQAHLPVRRLCIGVLLWTLVCLPLMTVEYPPLVDYPNHLARQHILAHLDHASHLQRYYVRQPAVLPNIAMDALVPFMSRIVRLASAGKLFVALTFLMLVSGVAVLNRAVWKSIGWAWIPAFFFLYNRAFLWGFLNYLFGVGLSLWMAALWITVEHWSPLKRVILFLPMALLLFFAHLYALGILGIFIAGRLIGRYAQDSGIPLRREAAVAAIPFVLPALLLFFFSPTAAADTAFACRYNFSQKFGALFQPLNNYNRILDAATFIGLAGLYGAGIATGRIGVDRSLAIVAGLLFGCFLVMPETVLTVQCVDVRMPNAIVFFLLAGSRFRPAQASGRTMKRLAAALLVLFAVRMAVITHHWTAARRIYDVYIAAIEKLPPGSTLFTAFGRASAWRPFPVPVAHIPCLAVIHRNAFVPSLFANSSQQPILFKTRWRSVAAQWSRTVYGGGAVPDWRACASDFQYLLVFEGNADFVRNTPAMARIFSSGPIRLYQTEVR